MKIKTNTRYILALLGITLIVCWACKKNPADEVEQNKAIFDGSARIRGTIFFKNILKGTTDTAKNVSLTIYKDDPANYYSLTLANGTFDLSGLSGGNYSFKAVYIGAIPGSTAKITYQKIIPVTIPKDQFQDNQLLTIDQQSAATPTLVLTVQNAGGAPVNNAQICLYTDPLSVSKYQNSCIGSVKSAVTNTYGIAVFPDLSNTKYYAAAYTAAAADTASNKTTAATTAYGPYATNTTDRQSITINPEKPTLNVNVTDINGANIPGAQVCIFSDLALITKYKYLCTGSLKSTTADQNGLAVFKNMQQIAYHISASRVVGKDTLSNVLTQGTAIAVLGTTTTNKVTVIIK